MELLRNCKYSQTKSRTRKTSNGKLNPNGLAEISPSSDQCSQMQIPCGRTQLQSRPKATNKTPF